MDLDNKHNYNHFSHPFICFTLISMFQTPSITNKHIFDFSFVAGFAPKMNVCLPLLAFSNSTNNTTKIQ